MGTSMSRKMFGTSFPNNEKEAQQDKETPQWKNDPSGLVPTWSNNTNNELPNGENTKQGPGTRRGLLVSSARHRPDTSPGAEAFSMPGRVFIDETTRCRPGAVAVPGVFGKEEAYYADDGLGEQATTIASSSHEEESTVNVIARAVDTEEENRIRRERDHFRHERDQLRHMFDNVVVVNNPVVVATDCDVENNSHGNNNHDHGLPRSDDPKCCGTRKRRGLLVGAILLLIVVVAVAVTLALLLPPPEPTLSDSLSELLSSVSSDGALADPSTPQHMALKWLKDDPNLETFSTETIVQRFALATLFYSASGASWNNSTNWLDSGEECNRWYGLTCTTTPGGLLGMMLNLSMNDLSGGIPQEIGLLTLLRYLDLNNYRRNKTLTGMIPTDIGGLVNLVHLDLSSNQLNGRIPTEIINLVNLDDVNLNENQLTGTVPPEIGSLVKLVGLDLSVNHLTGVIPSEIFSLFNLSHLVLSTNQLIGPMPTEIGRLVNLEGLYLSINQLSGMIPAEIGSLDGLVELFLDNNQLTGPIPTEIDSLVNLDKLYLYGNEFTGSYTCLDSIKECGISCDPWLDDGSYTDTCRSQ